MRADPAIQFNLPPLPKPEPKPPAWLEAVGKWLREHIFEPIGKALQWVGSFFPDAPYARIFLWTVLGAGGRGACLGDLQSAAPRRVAAEAAAVSRR